MKQEELVLGFWGQASDGEREEFTRKSVLGRNPGQVSVPMGALGFRFVHF